jgi:hypothetical protein
VPATNSRINPKKAEGRLSKGILQSVFWKIGVLED